MLRGRAGVSMPTSVAALEARFSPFDPYEIGTAERNESSVFQRTLRRKLTPHIRPASWNRIDLKGMRNSIVHPPSKSAAFVSQIVFQSVLAFSLATCESAIPPWALA